jgi:anthranilate 1,2-dioxygenase small subunit
MSALLSADHDTRAIFALLDQYIDCLDSDRLEEWPELFVPTGCYKVVSRENEALGLPAPLMYLYSQGMMQDRVTAIRDALTFEFVFTRHLTSAPQLTVQDDGTVRARSNFALYQSTEEGVTRLFCVGGYNDRLVHSGGVWLFAERTVVVDTFGIQNLIATPL